MRSAIAVALVVFAAGCGGGSSPNEAGKTTTTGEGAEVDFEVFASEYAFAPPFVIFDTPGTYTLSLRNDGFEEHNLTIEGEGATQNVQPGDTASVTVTLDGGVYAMVCSIHKARGMDGEVVVHDG